jgi:hypothetical protein
MRTLALSTRIKTPVLTGEMLQITLDIILLLSEISGFRVEYDGDNLLGYSAV